MAEVVEEDEMDRIYYHLYYLDICPDNRGSSICPEVNVRPKKSSFTVLLRDP